MQECHGLSTAAPALKGFRSQNLLPSVLPESSCRLPDARPAAVTASRQRLRENGDKALTDTCRDRVSEKPATDA